MAMFSGHFFHIYETEFFCFVVAICDLVHDTMHGLCLLLNSSRKSFLRYE